MFSISLQLPERQPDHSRCPPKCRFLLNSAPSNGKQRSSSAGLARLPERIGDVPAGEQNTGQPSVAVARDSLAFASRVEVSNVSASTLEHLSCEIARIAINYMHVPLLPPPAIPALTQPLWSAERLTEMLQAVQEGIEEHEAAPA